MVDYSSLNRLKVKPDFFKSSVFTNVFEAIAVIVDCSNDAKANNLHINKIDDDRWNGEFMLSFQDDGEGVKPDELTQFLNLSDCSKVFFGTSFKLAALRIGSDFVLFTKKENLCSIIFMGQTFQEENNIDELLIPMPSFEMVGDFYEPYYDKSLPLHRAQNKHRLEMEVIYKYSPFNSMEEIREQFDKIEGESGTRIFIFNVFLNNLKPEINFKKCSKKIDITVSNFVFDKTRKSRDEHFSLTSYLSVLYYTPRMKIYLENNRIITRNLELLLYLPRMVEYSTKTFKLKGKDEIDKIELELADARAHLRTNESKLSKLIVNEKEKSKKSSSYFSNVAKIRQEIDKSKENLGELVKAKKSLEADLKNRKKLKFTMGICISSKKSEGVYFYSDGRLISVRDHSKKCEHRGLVTLVNVPSNVLEASFCKTKFCSSQEENKLFNFVKEKLEIYADTIAENCHSSLWWRKFGYNKYDDEPSSDLTECIKIRIQCLNGLAIQCNDCLNWRLLRWVKDFEKGEFPKDNWTCLNWPDPNEFLCGQTKNLKNISILEEEELDERIVPKKRKTPKRTENLSKKSCTSTPSLENNNLKLLISEDEEEEVEEIRIYSKETTSNETSFVNSKLSHDAPSPKNFELAKRKNRDSNVPLSSESSPVSPPNSSEQALPERTNSNLFWEQKLKKKNDIIRILLRSKATDAMDSNLDNQISAFTDEELDGNKIFEFINKCQNKIIKRNREMKKDIKKMILNSVSILTSQDLIGNLTEKEMDLQKRLASSLMQKLIRRIGLKKKSIPGVENIEEVE